MASWATKRKLTYFSIVLIAIIIFLGLPTFFVVYQPPSCTDGKINQGELGTDCGGPCSRLCNSQFFQPIVLWARSAKVVKGVYNVVAYVENNNLDGAAKQVPYRFKLYDSEGVLIRERTGRVDIPPHKGVAVFEDSVLAGESIPTRVTFEFIGQPQWYRTASVDQGLVISDKLLENESSTPRLSAMVENKSALPIGKTSFVAILYGDDTNAISFSKTELDGLANGASSAIVFTWPQPFSKKVYRIDIIPTVKLK
ncbi:hypothetical protein EPO17_03455 [Patescibacteria group bacterium]|nr:MAG: hypothetical protein EPO17_03455 [Patescibacteria group bacterium]